MSIYPKLVCTLLALGLTLITAPVVAGETDAAFSP